MKRVLLYATFNDLLAAYYDGILKKQYYLNSLSLFMLE